MDKKKNKKNTSYSTNNLTFKSDDVIYIDDATEWHVHAITTSASTIDYSFNTSTTFSCTDNTYISTTDPFVELEKFQNDLEEDERLRKENPSLQETYEQYQLIKKLVQEEECDKYFHDKMKIFKR